MSEISCEPIGSCDNDQQSFKAYLTRWIAATIQIAPFTHDLLMPKLRASAQAAAKQCSGPNNACGLRWTQGDHFDSMKGPGEQMAAMEAFQVNLVGQVENRVTAKTGGTSKGNPNAGSESTDSGYIAALHRPITTGDRAGAWILTFLVIFSTFGCVYFMVV